LQRTMAYWEEVVTDDSCQRFAISVAW